MPRTGIPASSRPSGAGGAPAAYTEAGPPDRTTALGRRARICAVGMLDGTISECTWHSRTRRAMSCAYCAPKSTTRTVSAAAALPVSIWPERTSAAFPVIGLPPALAGRPPGPGPAGLASLAGRAWLLIGIGAWPRLAHPYPRDAPAVHLGDDQLAAGDLDGLAVTGQVAERGEDVAGHRLVR